MRIAQVVPIWEGVPPPKYGGTQRVVYNLTEGLVRNGHDVTLFATGDSATSAKLISTYPRPLYRDGISWENHLYPTMNCLEAFDRANDYDIIHCHIDRHTEYLALALVKYVKVPVVFTLHFIMPFSPKKTDRWQFLLRFKNLNFISISNSQRVSMPRLNFIATVYNGVNLAEIDFQSRAGSNLIWLGRMSESKGAREAIEIAMSTDYNLVMAGKIDQQKGEDLEYFQGEILPRIDNQKIKYVGEIDAKGRNKLFKEAFALLNPIMWEEPFGLVPVEAMAAGVPVVAYARGAMPELIKDAETGFLVEDTKEAKKVLDRVGKINRQRCRRHVEKNFSVEKMVSGYEEVYGRIVGKQVS